MKLKGLRIWFFIFGSIFLIAAFLYQQSINNQEQLRAQAIKAIALSKTNFLETYQSYHDQLDAYLSRNFYGLLDTEGTSPASQLVRVFDENKNRFDIVKIRPIPIGEIKEEILHLLNLKFIKKDSLYFIKEEKYRFVWEGQEREKDNSPDNLPLLFDKLSGMKEYQFEGDITQTAYSNIFEVDHYISLEKLMENNLNNRFFDQIYVVNRGGVVLYPGKASGLHLLNTEGLGKASEDQQSGDQRVRLTISTVEYEAFISPLVLGEEQLFLVGVKEKEEFQKVALRIDFHLLSIFLICLVLIFASIPLISIFSLSEGDILTKSRIFGLGLSLIVISLIFGYAFSFVQNQHTSLEMEVVKKVESDYLEWIHCFGEKLRALGKDMEPVCEPREEIAGIGSSYSFVNEYLRFDSLGRILTMQIPSLFLEDSTLDFAGNPFISIANRDYVKDVREDSIKFFISAHYSKASGNLEGVLSQKWGKEGKAITFPLYQITPKESNLYQFMLFKPGGKILFKSNKIPISISYIQEAIGESEWLEIQALARNNPDAPQQKIWEIPLYVNGLQYEAWLKRLDSDRLDEPVWMLFLFDVNLEHTFHSLASFEAGVFLLPYLLILILLSFFTIIANKPNIYLKLKSFSFDWFSPSPAKKDRFLFLNCLLALDVLFYLGVYFFLPLSIFKVFLWAAVFSIHASICNFLILHPKGNRGYDSSDFMFLIFALPLWLVLIGALFFLTAISQTVFWQWITAGILLVLFLMMVVCFQTIRQNKIPQITFPGTGKKENRSLRKLHRKLIHIWTFVTQSNVEKRVYSLCFLLWLFLIGFLPGYIIHRQAFVQEHFIWKNQLESTSQTIIPEQVDLRHIDLINKYEKVRRVNFSRFSVQQDSRIDDFIAPGQKDLIASFYFRKGGVFHQLFIKIMDNLGLILTVILFLLLLFTIIMRLSKRIYLTDYLYTSEKTALPEISKENPENFVIALDNLNARSWIMFHFNMDPSEMLLLDGIKGESEFSSLEAAHKVVVLENFHCVEEADNMIAMLQKLKDNYLKPGILLFILSGKPLQELLPKAGFHKEKLILTELMSTFIFHFVPLHFQLETWLLYCGEKRNKKEKLERKIPAQSLRSNFHGSEKFRWLNHEVNYGPNSQNICALISQELALDSMDEEISLDRFEKCLLTIQRYNKAYYMNIWNELNMKEKKMVYYFSKEGFINYTNRETMTALIQKGIFILNIRADRLIVFSRSFQNYVLVNATEDEVKLFKQEERKLGNAKMIQTATISFIFICIAIISYYDPNFLNQTSAYISGVIGIGGTIYSLVSKGWGSLKKEEELI